ncbi:MAG: DUF5103 domain-containing protein [Muribaculaceae bacterium]|nr:DUF5103 domain-containing protein [Muribaculaceae bacterium]
MNIVPARTKRSCYYTSVVPAIVMLLIFVNISASAQGTDTMTGIYDESIHTLQVCLDGYPFAPAVAVLGSSDIINIQFDQIAEDREYFRYSLSHCNANWQPSGLSEFEYLDGFNEGTIDDYDFSRGTTVHYVHYSLTIPNEQVTPTVSGNYLLKVYPESDPDTPVLQCRFMVSEGTVPVAVEAAGQTDIDFNNSHQQVSIVVDTENAGIRDPFNDLLVTVQQNGRLDNEAALPHPLKLVGARAHYEHMMPLIFEAGNEYRRFETVSTSYPGMGVAEIEYFYPYYHFTLGTDERRDSESYSYDQTQHGRFFVREYDSDNGATEADYGVVHFSLDYPDSQSAMIFLDGDFTLRRFDDNARMTFNPESGLYERSMLLKQGAYNYQYLIVPPGARRGYTAGIEGDKYQTVNEYLVKVYHRRPGERYDRLIGIGMANNRL